MFEHAEVADVSISPEAALNAARAAYQNESAKGAASDPDRLLALKRRVALLELDVSGVEKSVSGLTEAYRG